MVNGRRMHLRDLGVGWQSELLAHRFGAQIAEREDCVVLRSPGNPTFYWGNCLILPTAPRDADLAYWLRRFDEEIACLQPESLHLAFGVNAAALGEPLPSWRTAGVDEVDATAVLTLEPDAVCTPSVVRDAPGVVLRELDLPFELPMVVQAQVQARHPSFDAAGYRVFRERAMQRIAAMRGLGSAQWFGAVAGTTLAADCGLVHDGHTGRFQHVQTQPVWRRQGLCRALVYHVCRHAFEHLGLRRLVMCADPDDVAIGIYRSLGFRQIETHWSLQRRSPKDRQ
jgi:ribosomal protein S18 acetylase RimI-like enzyme